MKLTNILSRFFLSAFVAALFLSGAAAAENSPAKNSAIVQADSINLNAEISLWYEYYKNKDYPSALNHAWNIIEADPSTVKYKFYPRFEEMIWYMRDSVDTPDEEREVLADTMMFIYDKAIQYDEEKRGHWYARKAFVLENWHDVPVDSVIRVYEKAIEADPQIDNYYVDRLGLSYIKADDRTNAVDLYMGLAEEEPDNALWNERLEGLLGDNPEEMLNVLYNAWQLDKENTEKAWKYASFALKQQAYEKAIVALEFLTQQSPDVINYWIQLATAYNKTGNTDSAVSAYKTLIELQPDAKENYVNLAILYKDMGQLSVARSYLNKAKNIDSGYDYPYWIEGQLYEQAARNCVGNSFDFEDKIVYQLAVDTYRQAAAKGGMYSSAASDRANALSNSVPSQEDYFFRNYKSGQSIKITGDCYNWIDKSVIVP